MTKDYGDGHVRWTNGPGRGGRFAPKAATGVSGGADAHRRGTGRRPSQGPRPVAADTGPVSTPPAARLRRASIDQLTTWFHEISARPPGTAGLDAALLALDAELSRREGTPALTVRDDHRSRQVDELTGRGWSYLDAYAEVHHLDINALEKQERMQLVELERRPGEPRAKTIRRMYHDFVALSVIQAEEETGGYLFSNYGRAKDLRIREKGGLGVDPASLWYGNATTARKMASDELKQWWQDHGGRPTAAGWAAQFTGDRKAAEAMRMAGQGKDFGV